MNVATSPVVEVGVRELKDHLSRYLGRVRRGEEVVVTERGRPIARLSSIDHPSDRLADLIAGGAVRPPRCTERHRPGTRIEAGLPVSDLVVDQRR